MTNDPVKLTHHLGTAFKEWDAVCEALGDGRQSLILRKGGIEEGPDGFQPEYREFWLYPTRFHEARQGLKPGTAGRSLPTTVPETEIELEYLAAVTLVGRVERVEDLEALDPFHVWTRETVEKRFHYRTPGLWVLGVRVYRSLPIRLPVASTYHGCKSWVPLGLEIATDSAVPVLPEPAFHVCMGAVRSVLTLMAAS